MFGEKGGLAGTVDWFPIQDVVNALDKLREIRDETISLLQQVTGMSEIMRGQSAGQYQGVGQTQLMAKYGSVRVQALQDQFGEFASNLMQIKAEVIARHFSPETIGQRSNIGFTKDRDLAEQAIMLIKDPKQARLRVAIKPESVAIVDYAQLKMERTDFINALSMFLQSASPLITVQPDSMPYLLELLQWGLAGFKGSSQIEGVMDKAIEEAQRKLQEMQAQKEQQGDPAEKQAQMEMQREQMKQQGELAKIQAKAEADLRLRQADMQADIETIMRQHQAKMAEIQADMAAKIAETRAKMEADTFLEHAQAASNIKQTMASAQAEMGKDAASTSLEIEKEKVKSNLKIDEITATGTAKIAEAQVKSEESDNDDTETD
jgi:hypothetical protein